MSFNLCVGRRSEFVAGFSIKKGMAPFKSCGRTNQLDSTDTGRMPRSAVRLGAIRVLVSAVLLISMASGRPVHTISRFVCMGCERQGEFLRLYGSRRAAFTHVGKSPQCRALGLGVREISIAAGTGADVMAGGSGAAGPAPDVRHQPPGNLGYLKKNSYMQG